MTTFKQSAFVRVEDHDLRKELCEWLIRIGYNTPETWTDKRLDQCKTIRIDVDKVFRTLQCDVSIFSNCSRFIDCGTSIPMLKALAALRDDSDYMQWFITTKGKWVLSKYEHKRCNSQYAGVWKQICRKATPAEIVEHFKIK